MPGFQVADGAYSNTRAPNPTCCSDPAVLCEACARLALCPSGAANGGFFFSRSSRRGPTLNANEEAMIVSEMDAATQGSALVANDDDDGPQKEIVASGVVFGPSGERLEDAAGGLELDYRAIVANRRQSNHPARHSMADDDCTFVENEEQRIIAEMEPPLIDYAQEAANRRNGLR